MAGRQGFWEARIGLFDGGGFGKRGYGRVTNEKFEAGLANSAAPGSVAVV